MTNSISLHPKYVYVYAVGMGEQKDIENQLLFDQIEKLQSENKQLVATIASQQTEINTERQKWGRLLQNILPEEIFRELLVHGKVTPQYYPNVTVMFIDFIDFTSMCEHIDLQELIQELDIHFSHFDDICENHYLEKIKTVGDAYLCAGGMPMRNNSHPFDAILAAMDIASYLKRVNAEKEKLGKDQWKVRIGIHTGSVIAGVIGKRKFLYDIWGDTVNVACRIETSSEPGKINISGTTFALIQDYFSCVYRGRIPVKHQKEFDMYFVDGFLPQYSADAEGKVANADFKKAIGKL